MAIRNSCLRLTAIVAVMIVPVGISHAEDVHRLRFFLHPDLVSGLAPAQLQSRLTQYADDIKAIFAKQTIQRFTFDPATDITITATKPHTDSFSGGTIPETGFEMWIHAVLTDNALYGTYGGLGGIDASGAAVAGALRWDAVHDPSTLADASPGLMQYWRQIDHIVHEFEHGFGAGSGEYYSFRYVNDPTGIAPILNIRPEPQNAFWGTRQDYFTDPLLNNIYDLDIAGRPTTLNELRDAVRFADVTVAVVNRSPRNYQTSMLATIPDLSAASVSVVDDQTGQPISDALVRVWNVRNFPPYDYFELTVTSGSNHVHQFDWSEIPFPPFSNYGNLMLIKAFAEGYDSQAQWITTYDAQYEKLVNGKDQLVVTLNLQAIKTTDFNHDGVVDSADLHQWQRDFGENMLSDADNDGDSDGADFLAWQRQLGQGKPAVTVTERVPEPTTLMLLVSGALAIFGMSRSEG